MLYLGLIYSFKILNLLYMISSFSEASQTFPLLLLRKYEMREMSYSSKFDLEQWFPTWSTHTSVGTWEISKGTRTWNSSLMQFWKKCISKIFSEGCARFLFYCLGTEHKKVGNRWSRSSTTFMKRIFQNLKWQKWQIFKIDI